MPGPPLATSALAGGVMAPSARVIAMTIVENRITVNMGAPLARWVRRASGIRWTTGVREPSAGRWASGNAAKHCARFGQLEWSEAHGPAFPISARWVRGENGAWTARCGPHQEGPG